MNTNPLHTEQVSSAEMIASGSVSYKIYLLLNCKEQVLLQIVLAIML